jgi:hypothetical protein
VLARKIATTTGPTPVAASSAENRSTPNKGPESTLWRDYLTSVFSKRGVVAAEPPLGPVGFLRTRAEREETA